MKIKTESNDGSVGEPSCTKETHRPFGKGNSWGIVGGPLFRGAWGWTCWPWNDSSEMCNWLRCKLEWLWLRPLHLTQASLVITWFSLQFSTLAVSFWFSHALVSLYSTESHFIHKWNKWPKFLDNIYANAEPLGASPIVLPVPLTVDPSLSHSTAKDWATGPL